MKQITLPVGELKTALGGFNKVVSRGTTLPVLGCIRVQPTPDGVDLQVSDLDSVATYRIPAEAPADFPPCLISLAGLARVVKASKDHVWLSLEGLHSLKLRHLIGGHPVEQPIDSHPIEEWPAVPLVRAKPFLVEPGFKESFRYALECASTEATRLILNGAFLDVRQPDCHCLVGCDGKHLFSANTFHFPLNDSAVIPNRRLLNWSGFADDGDWLLAVEPPHQVEPAQPAYIQIQSNRWTFLTRGIEGQYPNWRQVMPGPDREFTAVKLTEEAIDLILDVLPRMPGAEDSGQPVTLVIEANRLVLRSRPRLGDEWTEVPINGVSVVGPEQRVCLDRTFVTKALRFGFTEFEVQDGFSPVLFTAPGKQMIVMPMRLEGPPVAEPAQVEPAPAKPTSQPGATPAETAEPAMPSAAQPDNQTEQHTAMATANNITALPAPERGNLKPTNGNGETTTAFKGVVEHIERIKTNLRDVVSDLNDTLDLLKAAEKEKKATLKEVESVRATLRSLQKMEL